MDDAYSVIYIRLYGAGGTKIVELESIINNSLCACIF